jgi:peptidoglycan hydrolase-like protein with peptidoglycan-binding domain
VGERKQGSSEAAKRSKPVPRRSAGRKASSQRAASRAPEDPASNAGKKKPRRAAPKIGAKKEKKVTAAKKSPSKKPPPGSETARGSRSGKARNGKDAETPAMAEEKSKIMAEPIENPADRRTAGGTDSARHAEAAATGSSSNGTEAAPSAKQATAKPETSVAETSINAGGRGESKPVSRAARKPATDKRVKPGDSSEPTPRPNTLVPTNGIHTTERRLKRRLPQNRTVMFLVGATLLGLLFIGEQTEPPDMTSVEAQIAAGQTGHARAEAGVDAPGGITQPRVQNPVEGPSARGQRVAAPGAETGNPISEPPRTGVPQERTAATEAPLEAQARDLDGEELVEMELMLARLDLAPSTADGIVDQQTRHAIRLYQQIAGLPVDGEPSPALLTDMREVVRILDGGDG